MWAALVLLTSVELIIFLDTSIVNISLPTIGHGLHMGEASLAWVVGAYQLTFGGFQLIGGRAADLLGRRRVFALGLAIFTLASLLAGVAPGTGLLLAARAIQGVGAAVVVPAEISLLASTFTEPAAYAKAFGVWSAMGAVGGAAGNALGGILTQELGWNSIFLINVPIGIVALALTRRLLPAGPPPDTGGPRLRRLDLPGTLTGTTGLLLIVYAITTAAGRGLDAVTISTGVAGITSVAVFLLIQARVAFPVMPLRLFRVRDVTGSTLANFMVGAAHVPVFLLLSLYLQQVWGFDPIEAGFGSLPLAIVGFASARVLLPRALQRHGPRRVLIGGMSLVTVALLLFARVPVHGSYVVDVLPAAVVFAIGLPGAFAGVTIPAVKAVPPSETGIASGVVQTAQRVGAAFGVTGATALVAFWTAHHGGGHTAYTDGLRLAFACAAGAAALCVVIAVAVIQPPRPPRSAPEGDARPAGRERPRETAASD